MVKKRVCLCLDDAALKNVDEKRGLIQRSTYINHILENVGKEREGGGK